MPALTYFCVHIIWFSVKTTLEINDALHARARALAAQLRIPLTRLVETALEEKLNRPNNPANARKRFRVKGFRLGMKPAYRGVNMNHLASDLENEAILQQMRRSRAAQGRK